ncbi:ATP synthase subunit b, mitochondrial-like [Oppia nitens]|uniref:ATP synthase subunit b, mitochondrial-like n=1 Tax=Oppia nitens TaxID=1686743 RepID=UPI0023DBB820|nr:ATP synthase subunit b, mitochondrial-like [Oppia nitens]
MLSRLLFNSKNLWLSGKSVQPVLTRSLSSITQHEVNVNPPLLPKLYDAADAPPETISFDPRKESLEEFLNIRFGVDMPTINDDKKPERDVKNFPRIPAPIWPDRTRLYVLPDSWFNYFYEKTGVTGPYVFGFTFITFLMSKEIYIIEHEFWTGLSLIILISAVNLKFGPKLREMYGRWQDDEVVLWDEWQSGMKKFLKNMIDSESKSQELAKQQKILFDAKRENIKLQLETEFRRRQMMAYNEVRNRLEYLLAKQSSERQYQQQHMVNWIIDGVLKGITAQQEKEVLQKCLTDLKQLSTKNKISLT